MQLLDEILIARGRRDFLSGGGSVLAIGGNYFLRDLPEGDWFDDGESMRRDWEEVGRDIRRSMALVRVESR